MTHASAPPRPDVDLGALRSAVGPVVGWYERFLTSDHVDIHEMEDSLSALRALPPFGGRVGRAVALLATGAGKVGTNTIVEALEVLRCAPGLGGRSSAHPPLVVPAAVEAARRFEVPAVAGTTLNVKQLELPDMP